MPRCEPHDLELASCADCRPRAGAPRPDLGPWFPAGYRSDCGECGGGIEPGDRIRADGGGGWLCTECGEAEEVFRAAAPPPQSVVPAEAGQLMDRPSFASFAAQARRYGSGESLDL